MKKKEFTKFIKDNFLEVLTENNMRKYRNDIYGYITDNVFKGIYFQLGTSKEDMTINLCVIILFEKTDFFGWNIGGRINRIKEEKDKWWGFDDRRGITEMNTMIKKVALPFFAKYETVEDIVSDYLGKQNEYKFLMYQVIHCLLYTKRWDLAMSTINDYEMDCDANDCTSEWGRERMDVILEFRSLIESHDYSKIDEILKRNILYVIEKLKFKNLMKTLSDHDS